MARNLLKDIDIRAVRPGTKRLLDGEGLYLLIDLARGRHQWQYSYTLSGRRGLRGLGVYPSTTLSIARTLAEECRRQAAAGIHPGEASKARKAQAKFKDAVAAAERRGEAAPGTFEALAFEVHRDLKGGWEAPDIMVRCIAGRRIPFAVTVPF